MKKVILVDDHAETRLMAPLFFMAPEFELHVCDSWEKLTQLMTSFDFDVIIVDGSVESDHDGHEWIKAWYEAGNRNAVLYAGRTYVLSNGIHQCPKADGGLSNLANYVKRTFP